MKSYSIKELLEKQPVGEPVEVNGWAGELFDIIGPATINSFSIYNNYQNRH